MKGPARKLWLFIPLALLLVSAVSVQASEDPPRISAEELQELLGNPGLVLLDVRLSRDWKESDRQIPGAVRENPHRMRKWVDKYPKDQKIVLYCA